MKKLEALLGGILQEATAARLRESWCLQGREERQLRLRTVTALLLELERIRRVSIFATALGTGTVETIIEGDWRQARERAGDFRFAHERPDLVEMYAPLWATFVVIVEAACEEHARLVSGQVSQPS